MKNVLACAIAALFVACSENGTSSEEFDASAVCPVNARGTFVDERDGQVYKYTTIGNQVWMAQNLNYAIEGSTCFYTDDDCREKRENIFVFVSIEGMSKWMAFAR
mgnify:CR=1 FL=1